VVAGYLGSLGPMKPRRKTGAPHSSGADSFVVSLTTGALDKLYLATPFALTEMALFQNATATFLFVDLWVICHVIFAAVVWLLISPTAWPTWSYLFLVYGAWRIFEICLYHMRILLGGHKKISTPNTIRSVRRSFLLALLNYAEVLLWFAALYRALAASFGTNAELVGTLTGSIYFSILTMSTYGDVAPSTTITRWLVIIHLAISLYLTLVVLARLVSLLPRPQSLDDDGA